MRRRMQVVEPCPGLHRRVTQRGEAAHTDPTAAVELVQPVQKVVESLRDRRAIELRPGDRTAFPRMGFEVRAGARPIPRARAESGLMSYALGELGEAALKKPWWSSIPASTCWSTQGALSNNAIMLSRVQR